MAEKVPRVRCSKDSKFFVRNKNLRINKSNFVYQALNIQQNNNSLTFQLKAEKAQNPALVCEISCFENNLINLKVDEIQQEYKRFQLVKSDFINDKVLVPEIFAVQQHNNLVEVNLKNNLSLQIQLQPFLITVLLNNAKCLIINSENLFSFEVYRTQQASRDNIFDATSLLEEEEYKSQWIDNFASRNDFMQIGPQALALDLKFCDSKLLCGIPEHADNFDLVDTFDSEPYRNYNFDAGMYPIRSRLPLYGNIPILQSYRNDCCVGVFWLNSSDNYTDVQTQQDGKLAHWVFEAGIMDIYLMVQPNPINLIQQFTTLTGPPLMPRFFSLGFHQCRWNYFTQQETEEVYEGYEKHDIPLDVIWLDIEEKQYLEWNYQTFPDPKGMFAKFWETGRRIVTIIDPHVKVSQNYEKYTNGLAKDVYVRNSDNLPYEGPCWPGNSSYPNFLNPAAREWWASYIPKDSTSSEQYLWIDMNEPSVFTSSTNTEVTMPKNSIHILPNYSRPIEHSEVHNAYGFYYHVASYDGLIKRDPNKRPFILTRSHFVGTQKYGAVWTGDNHAYWDHLEVSIPMVLSQAIAGISFIGADVGGFFQDPEPELIQRWTQLGAFYPFFRAHSHIETKKREPWLFGTEHVDIIRAATKIRYHLLPFWYTLFRKYAANSVPVITPLFIKTQNSLLVVEDQLFVGNAILVKPAVKPQQTTVEIKTGQDYPFWYNFYNLQKIEVQDSQISKSIDKNEIGVLIKPGSILVTYKEVCKSTEMMKKFPYTLIIALDQNHQAQGAFYDDDWTSFSFQQGQYVESNLIFKNLELSNELLNSNYESESQHLVAEIKILGLEKQFQDVKVNGVSKEAQFSFSNQVLTITNLEIRLNQVWKISFGS